MFPNELRDLLKHRLTDLESQLLTRVAELEKEKSQLSNETTAHRQRTENTLNSLLERITELEKSTAAIRHELFSQSWQMRLFFLTDIVPYQFKTFRFTCCPQYGIGRLVKGVSHSMSAPYTLWTPHENIAEIATEGKWAGKESKHEIYTYSQRKYVFELRSK